jgi:hypothetical protein
LNISVCCQHPEMRISISRYSLLRFGDPVLKLGIQLPCWDMIGCGWKLRKFWMVSIAMEAAMSPISCQLRMSYSRKLTKCPALFNLISISQRCWRQQSPGRRSHSTFGRKPQKNSIRPITMPLLTSRQQSHINTWLNYFHFFCSSIGFVSVWTT